MKALLLVAVLAGSPMIWSRKSLCAYIYHKQVEGWSIEQLRALARSSGVSERVIRWAEKNC